LFKHLLETGMADTVLDIKYWGNNLGVRLPAAVARAAHLHVDQQVRISVEGERIIITPLRDAALTLEQRLARFDPERPIARTSSGSTAIRSAAMKCVTCILSSCCRPKCSMRVPPWSSAYP
jgi:antitoxin MazE